MSKLIKLCFMWIKFVPLYFFICLEMWKQKEHDPFDIFWKIIISLVIFLVSTLTLSISLCYLYRFKKNKKENIQKKIRISKCEYNRNHSTNFLLSNVLPLLAFSLDSWQNILSLILTICLMNWLILRYNIFEEVIVLEFFNYRYYKCEIYFTDENNNDVECFKCSVISKSDIMNELNGNFNYSKLNNDLYLLFI